MSVRESQERMVKDAMLMRDLKSGEEQTFTNADGVKMVCIPQSHFLDMTEDVDFLEALRAAGVDNWEGYGEAWAYLEGDDE